MRCAVHIDSEAIAVCQSCGNALCSDCRITIAGIAYCQSCLDAGRIRQPPPIVAEPEDFLPTPLGTVTQTSRRNLLIGILGLGLIAVFIHFQWMFMFGYYQPIDFARYIPKTIGAVLVATGISLSAFAWYEFKHYFNFRWAFYIALFSLLTPWWGVLAELLIYTGLVIIPTGMYGSWIPGPLASVFSNLVIVSTVFFGTLMVLWAVSLLFVRKYSRSSKLILGTSITYLLLAHMMLLIIPIYSPSLILYPYPVLLYGYNSFIPAITIEIGVIWNAVFFHRLATSLKPY